MATKTTTTKSTRGRKTTTKTNVDEVVKAEAAASPEDAVTQMKAATEAMEKMAAITAQAVAKTEDNVKQAKRKGYAEDDMIVCKSVTEGKLMHVGKKSGTKYIWSGFGDTTEVEVQDLNSLRASKSQYLFKPLIMIEDAEFIAQDKWKDIKQMYDKIQADDIEDILKLNNSDFEIVLKDLPKGLQDAVKGAISAAILSDTFDSLQKVKIVDSVLGSDLKSLLK